jgi:hypothetical protein
VGGGRAQWDNKDVIVFKRVVSGQYQIVAETKYNLTIETSNPDGKYATSLFEQEWTNTCLLFSFYRVGRFSDAL